MAAGRHFLHVFPSFDPGGMEVRAAMVIDLLPAPDRHTIIAMDGRAGARARVRHADVTLAEPPVRGGFFATARAMAARVRALHPDLVLTYNWGAIETVLGCALARHRALIHHEEGFGVDEVVRFKRRRVLVRRLLLRRAAAVVVPSRVLERVAAERWRLPPALVRCFPNGVDLGRFAPRVAHARDEVVIGCVAHFRPEKDVPALVRAFAACSARGRARLHLVGDGPQREVTEQLARDLGVADRVEFLGALPDTAMAYGDMDVFALASRTEQMPLVVLEAMAAGLPVVAPSVGDIADMVAAENRDLIVAPADTAALTAALDRIIADAPGRVRLGAANRLACEARFDLGARLQAHLDLYATVLAAGA